MKNKGSKKSGTFFTSFCIAMLIFSCLFLASNIYIIIINGLDYVSAFYTVVGIGSVVLWSVYTNIGLKFLRELKNKPFEKSKIIKEEDAEIKTNSSENNQKSIYKYCVNLRYYDKQQRLAIYEKN